MDQQLRTNWPKALEPIARKLNPAHGEMFKKYPVSHYWSTYQSEWAIDTVFQKAEELRRLFPRLVHHGITTFSCTDVMRYLGKPILLSGEVPRRFAGDVVSDIKHREEGARIKHMINGNSVKLYDKAYTMPGSVLRAETTVHNGSDFRVYRPKEGDPNGKKSWRRMRRGIADLNRRAEISRKSAERYLNAYANVEDAPQPRPPGHPLPLGPHVHRGSPPPISMGQPATSTPSCTWLDHQNQRNPPISTDQLRPQDHHRNPLSPSSHHPPAHPHRRMKTFASGEESIG